MKLFYLNNDIEERIKYVIDRFCLPSNKLNKIVEELKSDKIDGSSNTLLSKIKSLLFTHNIIILLLLILLIIIICVIVKREMDKNKSDNK